MLTGPRATGKTTTALRHVIDAVRLDRPGEASAFHADPDVALAARPTPLLIDEWHVVPAVLGAVKLAVDADPRPGRYIITGSVRAASASDAMPRLYHLRDRDGHEIDLLLDYGRRGQLAIEVKATSAPTRHDARHLIWLCERLPHPACRTRPAHRTARVPAGQYDCCGADCRPLGVM